MRIPAEAEEPRSYDRRFYGRVLLAAFIVIVVSTVLVTYLFVAGSEEQTPPERFDLGSLFVLGCDAFPEASNPCMVLQEYLELVRRGLNEKAYEYLSAGAKKEVSLEEFTANNEKNGLLFEDVKRYRFERYNVHETAADASGYIEYGAGGKSLVEAAFAKEGDGWRIALVTVVYQ